MSADSKEDYQRQDLQGDDSSSSSSGSGSLDYETAPKEIDINDEQTTSSALGLPTSSSSSDLNVRNEENLQVAQSPGSQDQLSSQVQITGGEFVGAHFGPLTTNQHFNMEKHEHSQQINVHHHYHSAGSSEQGTSSEEPVGATGYTPDQHQAVTEEPSTSSEEVALCSFIKLFPTSHVSEYIFHGEQTSLLTGIRKLAIKFLPYKEEKLREAKILTKLNPHHNVVSIVHSDIYKLGPVKHIYIAMELCHKQNLQGYVNENKNFPFDLQLRISQAKQLIEGLKHIHFNDIIHRDLKPSNILFSLDKKTIKIADFGISKEMTRGRTVIDVTNARAGTDGYRAPETYNSNEISKQTDIFSLGLIFHFLWSNGHHPYGDDSDIWTYNIKKNIDRDLSHLLLPDEETAIDLLGWMLRFNPRERPTVSQILGHQMFGGTEKDPVPTSSVTTATGLDTAASSSTQERRRSGRKVGQGGAEESSSEQMKKMKPSTRKRRRNPEEMKSLEEKSQHHMKNEEYSLASEALQNLLKYQTGHWSRFETIQQLAECHVMCNVPIHEDIKKLHSMYESLRRSAYNIELLADGHFKQSRLVRAYFMYICASKLYKTHSSLSDAVKAIERCIKKIHEVVEKDKQVGSRSILSNYVHSCINEMLEDQASCYLELGVGNNKLGDCKRARDYLLQGLNVMKKHFKDDVGKHKLYGHISKNLMLSEVKLGNGEEAWVMYKQAIDVFKKAEDYKEEDERSKDIAKTRQELPPLRDI